MKKQQPQKNYYYTTKEEMQMVRMMMRVARIFDFKELNFHHDGGYMANDRMEVTIKLKPIKRGVVIRGK